MIFTKFKINKNGIVKARVFALILLILSTSLVLSSYKSLKREFSGSLFKKEKIDNLYSTGYLLYLVPTKSTEEKEEVLRVLSDDRPTMHRVGVSSLVYEASSELVRVSKSKFSIFILVGQERYFDKGLFWFIWALLGIMCSILMYYQTLKAAASTDFDVEEISVPGLN